MRGIRLIATDMDGTLLGLELGAIPPDNVRALRLASDAGIALALATGRLPDDAGFFAQDAGLAMHILALNGSAVLSEPLGRVSEACFIEHLAARKASGMIVASGLSYSLFALHDLAFSEPPEDLEGTLRMCGTFLDRPGGRTRCWMPDEPIEPLLGRTSKFVVDGHACPERLQALRRRIEAEVPEVEVTSSWAGVIEIIPAGVNKGTALTKLAGRLGIPMSQVMAIGDNDNDVSMLEVAGCAVAVANATDAAIRAAHWIAPSHADGGVATAVRGLALGDEAAMGALIRAQRRLLN